MFRVLAPPKLPWRASRARSSLCPPGDEKGDADSADDEDDGACPKRGAQAPDEGLAGRIGEPHTLSAPQLPGNHERRGQRLLRPGDRLPRHSARRVRKAGAVACVEHAAEDGYSEDASEFAREVVDGRGHALLALRQRGDDG